MAGRAGAILPIALGVVLARWGGAVGAPRPSQRLRAAATTRVMCNQCCRTCIEFHTTGTARGTAPKRQYPTTTNKGGTLETHTTRVRAGTAKGRVTSTLVGWGDPLTRWALDNAPALSS